MLDITRRVLIKICKDEITSVNSRHQLLVIWVFNCHVKSFSIQFYISIFSVLNNTSVSKRSPSFGKMVMKTCYTAL